MSNDPPSASIDDLPNELLSRIFLLCPGREEQQHVEPWLFTLSLVGHKNVFGPWTLGYVSRRWKVVAMDLSGLWTAFEIDGPGHSARRMDILETVLERTRQDRLQNELKELEEEEEAPIQCLARESHRIRSLTIKDPMGIGRQYAVLLEQSFPLLERLGLEGDQGKGWDQICDTNGHPWSESRTLQAPRLRSLHCHAYLLAHPSFFPVAQIQEIGIDKYGQTADAESFARRLADFPNLRDVGDWAYDADPFSDIPVERPFLKVTTMVSTTLLECSTCPRLQE